ncbi:MAG TPA: aminotransferase class I/II-fold pyridoxal phosphate-dependent enzyme [Deltaproteobacteria bacterium]|nr:aminotransferase class I/II-fold pyridoxal phosphate-dependent enzyme [Deltaproteobacteria bacterium]
MPLNDYNRDQLISQARKLTEANRRFQNAKLKLDLTRGKPSAAQLDLANGMGPLPMEQCFLEDGTDLRNYGGLDGIPEARKLGAAMLGLHTNEVIAGDHASLTLMYLYVFWAYQFGPLGEGTAWRDEGDVKFIAIVPGYDRHFSVCEEIGIEMVTAPFAEDGPDMEVIEELVSKNSSIKGMWCVPKYSNPTGHVYSSEVVDRIAALGHIAGPNFRVIWDNAYGVHDLTDSPPALPNIMERCRHYGTEDSVVQVASTSKITVAGGGISFLGGSKPNLDTFRKRLSIMTIGPNKLNQQRHVRFLKDFGGLQAHMRRHAEILRPKFAMVQKHLEDELRGKQLATWSDPQGGYFVSVDVKPGLATKIIRRAGEAGVKLTPAGATFPYHRDPEDQNIRIAPSFPPVEELDQAMQVFVNCVELTSVQHQLKEIGG